MLFFPSLCLSLSLVSDLFLCFLSLYSLSLCLNIPNIEIRSSTNYREEERGERHSDLFLVFVVFLFSHTIAFLISLSLSTFSLLQ